MDLSKAYTLIEPDSCEHFNSPGPQPPRHHNSLHWMKKNITTGNTGGTLFTEKDLDGIVLFSFLVFWIPHWWPCWNSFPKHNECDFYVSSVAWTMILACRACGLWEHKYRAGCIGHDQSMQAVKSKWSRDFIKRKTLGLQWSRYGLQNGGRRVYDETCACAFLKDKIIFDVGW